jgi:PAS domain S-box-containing protein
MKSEGASGICTIEELRSQAEEQLRAKMGDKIPACTNVETLGLFHELQVFQIKLEMQNAELRQAREELELVLEKYTDLYDFAPVGYFILDRDGAINSANLSGSSLLECERSLLIGRRFDQYIAKAFRDIFTDFMEIVFTGHPGKETCEVMLQSTRSSIYVQLEAIAIGDGRTCRVAVIDISARKRAEEALKAKQYELEAANSSLVSSLDQLYGSNRMMIQQSRLAAMGEMIGNIAHQWRQPLNTLGLFTQRIGYFYDTPSFNKEFLDTSIAKSMEIIQYMSRTIDDFRSFFATDREKSKFSVDEAVGKAISLIEASFKESRIHLERERSENVIINGYPNEYAQVLLNILINARDALTERNVTSPRVKITICSHNGVSLVTVADNAGGIPDDCADKIFDPYFTTKGPQQGTGVGLFISKAIIENNMGGTLTARNSAEGAEFRIEV